jgi:hypothetical protein
VLNGVEIGGGSVRLHDARTQRFVLERVLRVADTDQLHYLLAALDSGERARTRVDLHVQARRHTLVLHLVLIDTSHSCSAPRPFVK